VALAICAALGDIARRWQYRTARAIPRRWQYRTARVIPRRCNTAALQYRAVLGDIAGNTATVGLSADHRVLPGSTAR
jgi:hypothetical protein